MTATPSIDQNLGWLKQRHYAKIFDQLTAASQNRPLSGWQELLAAAADLGLGQVRSGLARARKSLHLNLAPLSQASGMKIIASVLLAEGHVTQAGDWFGQSAGLNPDDPETAEGLRRTALPDYLAPEASSPQRSFLRHPPREVAGSESDYIYAIDISGTCNLRCPTCPVGNAPLGGRGRGFMTPQLFHQVIEKILRERPSPNPQIWLFNWGEPLLHPQLPEFIRHLNQVGLRSYLSSNLNIRHRLDEVIAANPTDLKISLSGASQETYGQTHLRGNYAQVQENMRLLRRSLDRHQSTTHVWVGHHIYRHNRHEISTMAALCQELDFDHQPVAAFYQPLEALVEIAEGQAAAHPAVVDLLLESPESYLQRFAKVRDQRFDCELRFNQTVINHDGSVSLCCSTYAAANQLGVGFLDEDHSQLEARRYNHSFCQRCYRHGMQHAPSHPHDIVDSK